MKLIVQIPCFNEEETLPQTVADIPRDIAGVDTVEVLIIDDGSSDQTWDLIQRQADVFGLRLTENRGQSAAMIAGMRAASRDFIGTMDGDGQNDPADFPALLEAIHTGRGQIAVGKRARRQDSASRIIASRIANFIRRQFFRDGVSDTGCSLKVFPRAAAAVLVAFNGQHRFMPAVFLHAGYTLCEGPVNHRPRSAGTSKYTNWERALRGLYDLFGVAWLLRRKVNYPIIEQRPPCR